MAQTPSTPWPDNCRGAISLTFDDGHPTHLEKALPILAEYDLRATFYLNPRGDDWRGKPGPVARGRPRRSRDRQSHDQPSLLARPLG